MAQKITVVLEDEKLSAYEQAVAGPQNPVTVSRAVHQSPGDGISRRSRGSSSEPHW